MKLTIKTTEKPRYGVDNPLAHKEPRSVSVRTFCDYQSSYEVVEELFVPALRAYGYSEEQIKEAFDNFQIT